MGHPEIPAGAAKVAPSSNNLHIRMVGGHGGNRPVGRTIVDQDDLRPFRQGG